MNSYPVYMKIAERYYDTQMKIAGHVHQSWSLNRLSEHMVIREKVQGLVAELRYEMALAKVEMAYANLLAAIGKDPFPVNLSDEEIEKLAHGLEQRWEYLGQHATVSQLEQVEQESSRCELCNSPYRPQIDLLIEHKEDSQTWREVISEIRVKYGVTIKTPQTLIGHKKYH